MAVSFEISPDGHQLTIFITGRFDFASHQEFRASYEDVRNIKHYVVDLRGANYLDSSALGMLLLLRDHAGGEQSHIDLINCNSDVSKILHISNFTKLFNVR